MAERSTMSTTGRTNCGHRRAALAEGCFPPTILNKDIISYGILTAFVKGLQFLMLPLLTRLFSPTDYGLIEFMATLTSLATIMSTLRHFWACG